MVYTSLKKSLLLFQFFIFVFFSSFLCTELLFPSSSSINTFCAIINLCTKSLWCQLYCTKTLQYKDHLLYHELEVVDVFALSCLTLQRCFAEWGFGISKGIHAIQRRATTRFVDNAICKYDTTRDSTKIIKWLCIER